MIAKAKADAAEKGVVQHVWFFDVDGNAKTSEKYAANSNNVLVSENDGERYAKVEFYSDGKRKYYLKSVRNGRAGESVVDPYSLYGSSNDLNVFNDKTGSRLCEYSPVKEETLVDYVEYLKTRNAARLKQVERKYLNGEA